MIPFRSLTPAESHAIREDCIARAVEEFLAADAEADDALHEVAEFCGHARCWQQGDIRRFAHLNMVAAEKEQARRAALNRLNWEYCASVRAELEERKETP